MASAIGLNGWFVYVVAATCWDREGIVGGRDLPEWGGGMACVEYGHWK